MDNTIREVELTFGEMVLRSWDIYKTKFTTILFIILTVYIPVNTLYQVLLKNILATSAYHNYVNLLNLLEMILGVLATMAVIYLVEQSVLGFSVDLTAAFKHAFSRWLSAIGTNILSTIFLFFLFLLLVIPGIIFGVYYTFVSQAFTLRKVGGLDALGYSKGLVNGRWWQVFGIVLVISIIQIVCGVIVGFVFNFFPESTMLNITSTTITDIIGAFFTIFATIYFLNLDYLYNSIGFSKKEASENDTI